MSVRFLRYDRVEVQIHINFTIFNETELFLHGCLWIYNDKSYNGLKLIDKRNWTKVIFFNNQDSLLRPKNFLQLTWNFLSQLYLQTKQMWICRNKQTTCHFYNNWVKKSPKKIPSAKSIFYKMRYFRIKNIFS
jgi:hypothetical protein